MSHLKVNTCQQCEPWPIWELSQVLAMQLNLAVSNNNTVHLSCNCTIPSLVFITNKKKFGLP